MKIAVCDDEKEIRINIVKNIKLIYPDEEIIQFKDGISLLDYNEHIDILFLDIQMDGIDGIEVAKRFRRAKNNVTIIFVTAIEEYVFQAFDVGAFHYLLKPIEKAKFFEVLKKAIEDRKEINIKEMKTEASIIIKKGTITQKIYLCEIIYIEVFNRKIIVHKTDKDIEFYGKLSALEENLSSDFMRCHRAYIVNLRYVLKYDAGSITLENNTKILLAKQKYSEFVKRYMEYISGFAKKRQEI